MSPPWVLLHRSVYFIEGGSAGGAGKAAAAIGKLSRVVSLEEVTAALKPDPVVIDPPEVTSLSMVRHVPKDLMQGMKGGMVSSTVKGLVVLYAGMYQPGNGGYTQSGGYLVYDASSSSLSDPDSHLYLWRSACSSATANNPDGAQWMRTSAHLPLPAELCGPTSFFHMDMAFAFGGSCVCWADLLAGVLICDLFASEQ